MIAPARMGKVIVDGVNVAKKHQKPRPATMQGGIIDKDMPHRRLQRGHRQPADGKAHPGRVPLRRRRHQDPDLQAHRGRSRCRLATLPRLKTRYNDEIRPSSRTDLELANVMEVPRLDKIVVNMGVGDAVGAGPPARRSGRGSGHHHRPEAHHHPGQEVHRRLQAARGQGHRRQGHPAGRPHVGVPRPADLVGHSPHP